jgi:hypothetical protein
MTDVFWTRELQVNSNDKCLMVIPQSDCYIDYVQFNKRAGVF